MTKPPKQDKATNHKVPSRKRKSYTLRSQGKALLTTPFEHVARHNAADLFSDQRSVSLIANHEGRTLQHYIYGRPQR